MQVIAVRAGGQPFGSDWLAAPLAHAVATGLQPTQGGADDGELVSRRLEQRRGVLAFERERRALGSCSSSVLAELAASARPAKLRLERGDLLLLDQQ